MPAPTLCFLHGLDSSAQGTKGRWLGRRFPEMLRRDYQGDLAARLMQLESHLLGRSGLILIGSSFGGLMAACFALAHPERCRRLILLAPALNFTGFQPPPAPCPTPTLLVIGRHDTVTPPELVLPLARATFSALEVRMEEDDHLLHRIFAGLPWLELLT